MSVLWRDIEVGANIMIFVITLVGLPAGMQAEGADGLVAEWHFGEGVRGCFGG